MIPMVGVIVTLVLFVVTAGMGVYSFTMAAKNVSAIEEMFQGPNPYSYGSCLDNLQQLFGPLDYKLLLPLMPVRKDDGTSFPVVGLGKAQTTTASSSIASAGIPGGPRYGSAGV